MQIKRFEAQDMTGALRLIKQEFGSEAVILSARSLKREEGVFGFLKKPGVEVTAATDTSYPATKKNDSLRKTWKIYDDQPVLSPLPDLRKKNNLIESLKKEFGSFHFGFNPLGKKNHIPENDAKGLFDLYQQMLTQGVEEQIASELARKVNRATSSKKILKVEELNQSLIGAIEELGIIAGQKKMKPRKKKIAAFVGPTGAGKTTTIAKLAAIQALREKKKIALISLDTNRIGAIEQLKIYAKIIGVPIEIASNKKELEGALKKLRDKDFILIDSPGINQKDEYQLNELNGFFNKITPIEMHLVLCATTKEKDLMDAIERFKIMPITSLIFTKLDETLTCGTIINQLYRTAIPLSYFTNGRQVPEDIEAATLDKLVSLITNRKEDKAYGEGKKEVTPNFYSEGYCVANKNSDVFHYSTCKWVKKIKPKNMIVFENVADALNRKFKACKLCRPNNVEIGGIEKMNIEHRTSNIEY